jgi:hypothetical protein
MFAVVLGWLGNLLGGPFAKAAVDAYRAKLSAENTSEKIAADLKAKEIDLDAREAALNAQTVQVEQGNWMTRWVRPAWAAPFVIYTWKVVVWDKVLADWTHGSTAPLTGPIATLMTVVAAAYFGFRGLQYVVREFKK